MIILGIDPGTATTGYGAIELKKNRAIKAIDYGCIKTSPKFGAGERLRQINNELSRLFKKHQPEILAVESLFFFKNLKTAIPVSQAKGVILLVAAKRKVPVLEFTPLQVKMVLTGYGWSEKEKVQKKVQKMLCLRKIPKPDDIADALAIAICGALKINPLKPNKKQKA
jgi:crossover junction endodeoxyribonuclease RuvC